jgi:hypothetical protein
MDWRSRGMAQVVELLPFFFFFSGFSFGVRASHLQSGVQTPVPAPQKNRKSIYLLFNKLNNVNIKINY